jgi:hypothetical protein
MSSQAILIKGLKYFGIFLILSVLKRLSDQSYVTIHKHHCVRLIRQ